jgi:hypothetical protein
MLLKKQLPALLEEAKQQYRADSGWGSVLILNLRGQLSVQLAPTSCTADKENLAAMLKRLIREDGLQEFALIREVRRARGEEAGRHYRKAGSLACGESQKCCGSFATVRQLLAREFANGSSILSSSKQRCFPVRAAPCLIAGRQCADGGLSQARESEVLALAAGRTSKSASTLLHTVCKRAITRSSGIRSPTSGLAGSARACGCAFPAAGCAVRASGFRDSDR